MRWSNSSLYRQFMGRVERTPECWVWLGALSDTGYGTFTANGKTVLAHRWIMQAPKGREVDHLCKNKRCVRPSHLEIVTKSENARRHWAKHPHHSKGVRKEACKNGHSDWATVQSGTNRGRRYCKECNRQNAADYYHRRGRYAVV